MHTNSKIIGKYKTNAMDKYCRVKKSNLHIERSKSSALSIGNRTAAAVSEEHLVGNSDHDRFPFSRTPDPEEDGIS